MIKEFVKVRAENYRLDETPEEKKKLDEEAVKSQLRA